MSTAIKGVVPILVTPFHPDGSIDEASLESLIDFNVEAGVHGLGVALGSEVFKFNEAERAQITRATIKGVNGRVPVIINSGAAGTDLAVFYSKAAEAAGADALMVIPPSFMPVSSDEIFEYYKAIDAAVGIPIILQDVPQGPVGPALALRIADACRNVKYIKVETLPVTQKVQAMSSAIGDRLTIFGGAGGSYFIEEMRRGAHGTMPFCSQPADFVAVWDAFQAGDEATARTRFDATIMAVNRLGNQGGDIFYAIHKQLLVRLGIIRHALVRSPTTAIDAITQREIDELIAGIAPEAKGFRG
ncbi:MAG: dihydrodipicolinate synthase family protein [Devosia sp.]